MIVTRKRNGEEPEDCLYFPVDASATMFLDYLIGENNTSAQALNRSWADEIMGEFMCFPDGENGFVELNGIGNVGTFHFVYRSKLFVIIRNKRKGRYRFKVKLISRVRDIIMKFNGNGPSEKRKKNDEEEEDDEDEYWENTMFGDYPDS